MSRYIDADKLLESTIAKFKCVPLVGVPSCRNGAEYFDGETIDELINDAPTADVVEVRHGKWHYPPYAPFGGSYEMKRCSICGYKPDFDADNPYSNFCPNCGAKMDGERREG